MSISKYEKNNILKRLPDLKLSYENIHKKVFSDLYFLIPKGKKYIVWFTYYQDKKVCIFVETNPGSKKIINNMFIVPQIFEKKLVLGTIFYGTLFNVNNKRFFSIENIHYYKGKNIEHNTEKYKLNIIKQILETELKSCSVTTNGVCMAMPIIESSFEKSIETAKLLSYKIYSIQNRNLNGKNILYNSTLYKYTDSDENTKIFMVKADIKNDVYHLFYNDYNYKLVKYNIAYIPDYKTSVMMNNIFRKIKENINLDALEESDDEEEFENMNDDKFVDLDKCVKMECIFNSKFNKYVPIKLNEYGTVCKKRDLV
jgi:hypothetical protein